MKHLLRILTTLLITAGIGLSVSACKDKDDEAGVEGDKKVVEVQDPIDVNEDQLAAEMEAERKEFIASLEQREQQLDQGIEKLEANLEQMGAEAKAETRETLEQLREQRKQLDTRIDSLQQATAQQWQEAKAATSKAFDDLEAEYNEALEAMQTGEAEAQ